MILWRQVLSVGLIFCRVYFDMPAFASPMTSSEEESPTYTAHSVSRKTQVSAETFQKAWRGDVGASTMVDSFLKKRQLIKAEDAHDFVVSLPHDKLCLNVFRWCCTPQAEEGEEDREKLLEEGMASVDRVKFRKMLSYAYKTTLQDQMTVFQMLSVCAGVAVACMAALSDKPIFVGSLSDIIGGELFGMTLGEQAKTVISIVAVATALVEGVPRLGEFGRWFARPSKNAFSFGEPRFKKYFKRVAIGLGALFPGFMQLYFLVDVKRQATPSSSSVTSGETSNSLQMEYIGVYGAFLFIDGLTKGISRLQGALHFLDRKISGDPLPPLISDPLKIYRNGLISQLKSLRKAFYWMPDSLVRMVYETVFNPKDYQDLKDGRTHTTRDNIQAALALQKLQYLVGLAQKLKNDPEGLRKQTSRTWEAMSYTFSFLATPIRYMAYQVIFKLLLFTFSFGYLSEGEASLGAHVLSGLSLLPGALNEMQGQLELPMLFQHNQPHSNSALKGIRWPLRGLSVAEGMWELLPLVALCLNTRDEWLNGENSALLLAAPFVILDFLGNTSRTAQSLAHILPMVLYRIYTKMTGVFCCQPRVGFMRDELVSLSQRLTELVEEFDEETLNWFKEEVMEQNWRGVQEKSESNSRSDSSGDDMVSVDLKTTEEEEEENRDSSD